MNPKQQDSIDKMIKEALQFAPEGICPYCSKDVMKGEKITERTGIITKCKNCGMSLVD
jgi:hypothetical protein